MAETEKQIEAELQSLLLSSSPHIVSPVSIRPLMANVLIALSPAAIFGVVLYGLPAFLTILVSVASAAAAEALFRTVIGKEIRVLDLSSAVTGLLLALVIPPGTPLWMTALGAVFAVVVAKEFFGGLGANVFNPALIGRAFLLMSFPAAITSWAIPETFSRGLADGVSSATPLGIVKLGLDGGLSFSQALSEVGASFSASGLTAAGDYWTVMKTLFLGNHGGCIGESSGLLILLGGLYLLVTKTIDWRAPAAMTAGAFLLSLVLGLDPLFTLLGGGLLFGALFMTTDYVTAPVTATGKLLFGLGAGIITVLIRKWGNYPEGVSYGILIMNALTPFLNRFIQKKYGFVPKKKNEPKGAAK
ncbi:MAG: RnfABCDGE type electron transport complex subunit D [Spirochaetaceae bacterium]|jgi:electron transport complex protein RnfD|nr:RnfABCDGE type electron transport complex subunit D [Spirochaetaceae bacterium]